MVYSILSEARIRHSVAPKQPDSIQYQVVWDTNRDLKDWTTFVNVDIVGAWGGFLFGTKRTKSEGFIGPSSNFPPVDALVNERVFFRLKYDKNPKSQGASTFGKIAWTTVADPLFDDIKSITFDLISDGKWHLYEIDMGESASWVGEVNRVRFYPCEDGHFNDEFFLGFFEIGTNAFDFSFDNENAGSPGFAEGGNPILGSTLIEKDVNDKLIVNIDNYGDVQITLTPQEVSPILLARDISLQLGKIAIGGYIRAEAFMGDDQLLRIDSGTRAADSSVVVTDGPNSAAFDLGFVDQFGSFIGTLGTGTDPSVFYEPLSTYRPTTLEIMAMFDNDESLPAFSLDPQQYIVQAGNIDFDVISQVIAQEVILEGRNTGLQGQQFNIEDTLDGSGTTFIDLNHPFSDSGKVDKIFMNGVPVQAGGSKWKIFRPSLDGQLTLVSEGEIGKKDFSDDPNGGLVGSPVPDVFVADLTTLDIQVRRGDLLGIYNVGLHAGAGNALKPNALYYEIAGDVTGTVTAPPPSGAGEAGLAIYAHGLITKNRAVIDIDLQRRLNIDELKVTGLEDQVNLEYNLGIATSASYTPTVSGVHTICYNDTPSTRVCIERQNEAFNAQALNDGIILSENGVSAFGDGGVGGVGGANAAGATYFYVNGDGEFYDVFEFVGDNPEGYNFQRAGVGINCFFGGQLPRLDKPVGKVVMHFKEKKNQRSWQLEYFSGGSGGNGSLGGFSIIPEDTINHIRIDQQTIENLPPFASLKNAQADLLLANPARLDTVAADGTVNPQQGVDYVRSVAELGGVNYREQVSFLEIQWNRFEWSFDAIRTSALRWYSDFHWSTKISEMEVYGVSSSNESLADNVQVFFSAEGQLFTTAELITGNETESRYKMGNSPQFIRLVIRPTLQTSINDVKVEFEQDQVCFGEEGRIQNSMHLTDARVGSIGASVPLKVTNTLGQPADLIVDLPEDIGTAKQLLYFNQLNSEEDIQSPQIGAPGRVDFGEGKILKEESSVTINADAYGLLNLVSGTESFRSSNLAINGGFATGDLTGWDLEVINSGTLSFQIPRVDDFSTSSTASIQLGNYSFGVNMDKQEPAQDQQFAQVTFTLAQTTNITAFATSVDQGAATFDWGFDYANYGTGPAPEFRLLGAPTLSGVLEPPGTIIDSSYGSNLLASFNGRLSSDLDNASTGNVDFDAETVIKQNTRYVRVELYVDKTGPQVDVDDAREIWHMDRYSAFVNAPAVTAVNWYKSYLTGVKDFTDAQYVPVDASLVVAVTGSHHWYQPANPTPTSTPGGGQTQNYSLAFTQDRNDGVQSFARMNAVDPGILGMQWVGEKKIAGIRIAHSAKIGAFECQFAQYYPRLWDIEVLKTKVELGGVDPDLNDTTHWKAVRRVSSLIRDEGPATLSTNLGFDGSLSKITTFVFDPVFTEGVRIVYLINCDFHERDLYPDFASFNAATGCPTNNVIGDNFSSLSGVYAGMFMALESLGRNTLPIDNTADRELTPGVGECGGLNGTIHVAVDLGRHFDVDTDSDLFELISQTVNQTQWSISGALFSADNTSDPNQVNWTGGASFTRWLRFTSAAEDEWEAGQQGSTGGDSTDGQSPYQILYLPQSILQQARVYPKLQTSYIPHEGANHFWTYLGKTLTDNSNITFINYSDYPVVCLDLNKTYVIKPTSAATQLRRDLITPGPVGASDDKLYWDVDNDSGFAYPVGTATNVTDPSIIQYNSWGGAVPSSAIRWLAVRGVENLLQSDGFTEPKQWNFETQGGTLFGVNFAPATPQVFTENANWFTTARAGLVDISTFDSTQGSLYSLVEGVDYGASHNSSNLGGIGEPFYVWDGKFDEISADDYWGVYLKDSVTDLTIPGSEFPHSVWRVFKDPYRGTIITKEVKAITILGYDEFFYPTDFQIQSLNSTSADPTLDASWTTITDSTFTGVNTYNQGIGFTFIWPAVVETAGIRIYITDSEYPDESVTNQPNEVGQANQFGIGRGPQTRLISVQIFEEGSQAAVLEGTIETNHAWNSAVTSLTNTPNHEASYMVDNDITTFFQSTGFQDTLTVTLDGAKQIDRFEWEMDEEYAKQVGTGLFTNAPATFTLKANPNFPATFETVLFQENFEGLTFSGTINPPVTADTWVLEVDSVQGQLEDASSIIIHEFRLIEEQEQGTPLVIMTDVYDRRPGGNNLRSTQITYAADSNAVANVSLNGIDANNDGEFSERDFFVFWLWVNDISLLDTGFGTIRLGNNREVSYTWEIKDLNLNTGWNELKLQFLTAADRAEIPFQPGPTFDLNVGESEVDFFTADQVITSSIDGNYTRNILEAPGIRYFEIEFRGRNTATELELRLDDMRFVRNHFDDVCRFAPSLYLNNSETFTIYLEGLDLSVGTVEFWMQPDWDLTARIDRFRSVLPSIFKILRPDGKFLTFFFRPTLGFVTIINDLERIHNFQSSLDTYSFDKYDTFHVAVVWDVLGRIGTLRSTLQILINGEIVYASNRTWEGLREGGATVMFGGEVGQSVGATPHNPAAKTFTAVQTLPQSNTSSSWALLENIKIYNYAKENFDDINEQDLSRSQLLKPSQMLQISLDDITFHSSGSDGLPLVVQDVPSEQDGTIYIRSNIPKDITGNEDRDASLLVRWKTPLINCD
jgi:hypothetical protein